MNRQFRQVRQFDLKQCDKRSHGKLYEKAGTSTQRARRRTGKDTFSHILAEMKKMDFAAKQLQKDSTEFAEKIWAVAKLVEETASAEAASAKEREIAARAQAFVVSNARSRLDDLMCPVCAETVEQVTFPPCQHLICMKCLAISHAECAVCRDSIGDVIFKKLKVNISRRDEIRTLLCVVHPELIVANELVKALESSATSTDVIRTLSSKITEDPGHGVMERIAVAIGNATPLQKLAMCDNSVLCQDPVSIVIAVGRVVMKSGNDEQIINAIEEMKRCKKWNAWNTTTYFSGEIGTAQCDHMNVAKTAYMKVRTRRAVESITTFIQLIKGMISTAYVTAHDEALLRIDPIVAVVA